MNAREMFKELGYENDVDSFGFLQYYNEFETRYTWDRFMVVFNRKTNKWFVGHNFIIGNGDLQKEEYTNKIDEKLHQAIHQQMIELKWLK